MSLKMPEPDQATIRRRRDIAAALGKILPPDAIVVEESMRRVYESDGLSAYRQLPLLVTLPRTTAEVAAVLAFCHREGIKVVPRGAGTSLSGGALPLA